jgi:hypothetical protein
VGVLERNLARILGVEVGDSVRVETPAGTVAFEIIGISANQQEEGSVLFAPTTTIRSILPASQRTGCWIRTSSPDRDLIDRTATRIEDSLIEAGCGVFAEIPCLAARGRKPRTAR